MPIATATVVDTVGAGDTFMAGLVVGLSDAGVATRDQLHEVDLDTLESVGRFAAAAAAITVGRVGAGSAIDFDPRLSPEAAASPT